MMADLDILRGLAVALGLGLLVGVERERRRDDDGHGVAGVRTFALIGLAGAIAERIGGIGIALGGAFVVLAALAGYRASREHRPRVCHAACQGAESHSSADPCWH